MSFQRGARAVVVPIVLGRRTLLLQRSFHVWPSLFKATVVKDVYKMIDYMSPYDDEESQLILDKINKAPLAELNLFTNKTRASALEKHRNAHGEFESVEQILDVRNFDPKSLELLGKKVIKHKENDNQKLIDKTVELENSLVNRLKKHVKPKPTDYLTEHVHTICGIKLFVGMLSYSHMYKTGFQNPEKDRQLLSWQTLATFEDPAAKSNADHHVIYQTARKVVSEIPEADMYIFEQQPPINVGAKDANLLPKVRLLELQFSIISLLNLRGEGGGSLQEEENGVNRVYLMKMAVLDELFKLRVGTERVSNSGSFRKLIIDSELEQPSINKVKGARVSSEQWNYHNKLDNRVNQEQLRASCMVAMAFDHLFSKSLK